MLSKPVSPAGLTLIRHILGISAEYCLPIGGTAYVNAAPLLSSRLLRALYFCPFFPPFLLVALWTNGMEAEVIQIMREAYDTQFPRFSNTSAKRAKKALMKVMVYPIIRGMLSLVCFPPSLADFREEMKITVTAFEEVVVRFTDLLASRGDSLRLLDVLCVPFPALALYLAHKPYLNIAFSAQEKLQKILRKNHVDETLISELFKETRGNLAREMQRQLRRVGKAALKLAPPECICANGAKEKSTDDHCASGAEEASVDDYTEISDCANGATTWTVAQQQAVDDWLSSVLNSRGEDAEAFQTAWSTFMAEFGCRGFSEIDIAAPRWEETPAEILRFALRLAGTPDLSDEEVEKRHNAALAQICANMSRRKKRKVETLFQKGQLFWEYREHHKHYYIQILAVFRKAFQLAGERMKTAGIIDAVSDVFFLELEDVLWWEEGRTDGADFRGTIATNKRNESDRFPRVVLGPECEFCWLSRKTRAMMESMPAGMLRGVAASGGVAEGRAVVARDPAGVELREGDVLVASGTDPGWTPLFGLAKAVAVEVGGPLSHGAVVAKENGIPCVVSVMGLMEKVKTGMKVRVDGDRGIVEIVSE